MIFVTVGTHEQGLDRLLIELDRLVESGEIKCEIFAQIGYSLYKPKNYKYAKMIGYDEMDKCVEEANIVITHGGPGSIFHPLQYGKIPIVVPRNPHFNEHIDNHQILFAEKMEKQSKIIAVYNIEDLKVKIDKYDKLSSECNYSKSKENEFVKKFAMLIDEMVRI